jgi:hypothetical protein
MTFHIINLDSKGANARVTIERGNSTGFPAHGFLMDDKANIVTETPSIIYGGYCHAEIVIKVILALLNDDDDDDDENLDWSDLEPLVADAGLECRCEDTE